MQVRALRGVCIGPGRYLLPTEIAELDPATVQFLVSINAVERVVVPKPVVEAKAEPAPIVAPEPETETPAKPGKKEK